MVQVSKNTRIDASLIASKDSYEKTPTGYKVFATIGDIKQELPYLMWDGKNIANRIELIGKEELFKEESMLSAFGQPVTLGHTPEGYFNLNKDGLQVGSSLQEYRRNDARGTLDLLLTIQDCRGVQLIDEELEQGKIPEISPTYDVKKIIKREDGKYWQIGRQYDSFALLRAGRGRGGSAIALRFDSKDNHPPLNFGVNPQYFIFEPPKQENPKVKDLVLRIDGKSDHIFRDVDDDLANGVNDLMQRLDSMNTELQNLKTQLSTTTAQLDGAKIKLSETEKALSEAQSQRMDDNAIALELEKRGEVWDLVEPHLKQIATENGKEFRRDGKLSVPQIQELYIKSKDSTLNLDGKDEAYIAALWDYLKPKPGDKPTVSVKPQSRVDTLYDWLTDGGNANKGQESLSNPQLRTDDFSDSRAAYTSRIEKGSSKK